MLLVITVIGAAGAAIPALSADPAPDLEGIHHFQHIVVLPLENETEDVTFGAGSPATYLNSLRSSGVFVPNYYGTGHVSLPNYIGMVSGQPGNGVTNTDCFEFSLFVCAQTTTAMANGRNLGDQLDDANVSWKSYMDGTPSPCYHSPYSTDPGDVAYPDGYQGDGDGAPDGAGDYADRHNPFIYFPDFVGNQARCIAHQRPFTELATDLAQNQLPQFSFITPDTCHDGHDAPCSNGSPGGLASADAWLQQQLPPLLSYLAANDGLLVINFDESGSSVKGVPNSYTPCSACAGEGLGGRTGALFISPHLNVGSTVTTAFDHFSLLRTIEDSFGITEHLNLAANAAPMDDVLQWSSG